MSLLQIVVAVLLAFTGMVLLAPIYINLLQRLGFGKQIRTEGPESHYGKAGTPTMGGMLIVGVVLFLAMALRIEDAATLTPMLTLVGVGILGAIDDFVNVRTGIGMRGRWKLVWLTIVALLTAFYIWRHFDLTGINVPFLGQFEVDADPAHRLHRLRHRRHQQRREPDRWARRPRRRRPHLQLRRVPADQPGPDRRASSWSSRTSPSSARSSSARWRASCGSTCIRRRSSWATRAR